MQKIRNVVLWLVSLYLDRILSEKQSTTTIIVVYTVHSNTVVSFVTTDITITSDTQEQMLLIC